jgi:hypothetical protein
VRDVMAKRIWGNKFELGTLSTLALVLDNRDPAQGVTTEQMVEWLLRGDGELEFTFYNGFDRDGMGGESAPGYSSIWKPADRRCGGEPDAAGGGHRQGPEMVAHRAGAQRIVPARQAFPRASATARAISRAHTAPVDPSLFRFGVAHFNDAYCADLLLKSRKPEDELLSRQTIDESRLTETGQRDAIPKVAANPQPRRLRSCDPRARRRRGNAQRELVLRIHPRHRTAIATG